MDNNFKNQNLIPDDDYEYEQQEHQKRIAAEKALEAKLEEQKELERQERLNREKRLAEEKVELIRLKSGVIDESDTIKEEHDIIREVHGVERISNFWYHNKIILIFIAFLIVVIGFIVYDTITREKPDITVMMIANNGLSARQDELEAFFEKYTDDLNGDGKVHVSVMIMPLSEGVDQMQQVYSSKFLAQLQSSQCIIAITDSNTDPYYQDIFKKDLNKDFPDNPYIDEFGFSLNMKLVADELKFEYMPNDVHICMREPIKTVEDSLEQMQENYKVNFKVFEKIVNDLTAKAIETNDAGLKTEPAKQLDSSNADSNIK